MRGIIIATPISLLMWAAIIYGVMCATAKAMDDDIKLLALMNFDRAICGAYVDQNEIDKQLYAASIKYRMDPMKIADVAAEVSTIIRDHLRDTGATDQYCAARIKR